MALVTTWRGGFSNREVDLEAAVTGRPAPIKERNWIRILDTYALGWVCMRDESGTLIGFADIGPPLTAGVTDLVPLVHPRADRDVLDRLRRGGPQGGPSGSPDRADRPHTAQTLRPLRRASTLCAVDRRTA